MAILKNNLPLSGKTNQVIIIIFIVLSLPLLFSHEPWRDEGHSWIIARDSPSITSLIHSMGYEGHPPLWYFVLFTLAKLGLPYFSMTIIHFLMMLSAVIVFVSYAPFSQWQKTLFVFGYYIIYEYNIIARNYALSVLVLFLIAHIYKERFQKPISYSLLILLLANTNVHSLIFAIVLSGVYIFEANFRKNIKLTTKEYLVSFFIMLIGIFVSIYLLWPPADLGPAFRQWNFDLTLWHFRVIPNSIVGAFLPIPYPHINFWNSRLVYITTLPLTILGGSLFLLILGFFIKKPMPMVIYLLLSTGLLSILFFKYPGYLRHHGLLFILFIFCLWISKTYNEKLLIQSKLFELFSSFPYSKLFSILLLCQVAASPIAFYYELNYDFSAGEQTATFLKENGFLSEDTFIATYRSYIATAILPYIPKPYSQFYFLEYQEYRSFMIWNTKYYNSEVLSVQEIVARVDTAILNQNYRTVILILNFKVEGENEFSERYSLIAYFDNTIEINDHCYIYKLVKPKPYSVRHAMTR